MCNKENICCCFTGLLTALLASVGIAAIFYEGLITSIIVLVYLALVVGLASLLLILFLFFCKNSGCRCIKNNCLLSTSIISIILSIFALTSSSLATFSISVAIFIGALTFVFLNNIISLVNVLICSSCDRSCN